MTLRGESWTMEVSKDDRLPSFDKVQSSVQSFEKSGWSIDVYINNWT